MERHFIEYFAQFSSEIHAPLTRHSLRGRMVVASRNERHGIGQAGEDRCPNRKMEQ
ncbi:hypothetical protein [Profundibacterium mesophilum]|uniref:Uncharacterized protein n=1 Tax=Profundibacterium mesophilum KAUST100406-0324 TaxID=1037889 RepID=A0A921NZ98_9RHOB|nr:hypothetical protein [Profundibacterium mesophilum]KAF0676253.1 hypothetical protein PMES_01410 [Profundibacterium mesophilum KAUST100406-0324]